METWAAEIKRWAMRRFGVLSWELEEAYHPRQVRRPGSQTSRALIDTFGARRALASR